MSDKATPATDAPRLARKYIPEAFTVAHFVEWASEIVLDNDELWVLEQFQVDFVEDLFSGKAIAWLVIPEGNGKTTLIAGLGLYYCEFQPHAKVLACAAAVEQAQVIYEQAEGMVLRTPRLHEMAVSSVLLAKGKKTVDRPRFECLEGWKRINHVSGSRFQVKPADQATGDGVIPTLCLVDELHRHRTLGLYRTWAGKLRKRGGQMIVISTAGEPGGEFETARESMRQTGVVTKQECFVRSDGPTWVLHDWAVPEGSDVHDLELVAQANPLSLVTEATLAETWETPGMTTQHFARLNANLPMRGNSAAITEREWFDAATLEPAPERSDWWVGLDVGWRWDTTAFVPFCWVSEEVRLFGPASIIVPPRDGSSTDPSVIKEAFERIAAERKVSGIVMDTNKAEDLAAWFSDDLGLIVVDRAQTPVPQAEDYERFMQALRQGWLRHPSDPGLTRHALNAVTKLSQDGRTVKFGRVTETRQGGNQDVRVIDALVAAAMVHSVCTERAEVWNLAW